MKPNLAWIVALGCGSSEPVHLLDAPEPDVISLRVVSGDNQVAPIYATLRDPLVVRAENQRGEPVVGTLIRFSGEGFVTDERIVTNADGIAETRLGVLDVDNLTETEHVFEFVATIEGTETQARARATAFEPYPGNVTFTIGTPTAVGIDADFDADGKPDLFILRGNTFSAALNQIAPGSDEPFFSDLVDVSLAPVGIDAGARNSALGDFDLDGKLDVAVTLPGRGAIGVLVNKTVSGTGLPAFELTELASSAPGGAAVVAADFSGDGKLDLAVVIGASVDVFTNTTTAGAVPTFARSSTALPRASASCSTTDVNRDGRPDLLFGGSAGISVLMNTTEGFVPGGGLDGELDPISSAGDVSGDGKDELAIGLRAPAASRVGVVFNATPVGATTANLAVVAIQSFTATPTSPPTLVDVNGDGDLDIVTATSLDGATTITIHYNLPTIFVPKNYFIGAGTPSRVSASDLDGNGGVDLAVTGPGNRMQILMHGKTM